MQRIGVITSSTRPTRIGHKVGAWVAEQAPEGVELDLVDLGELNLPFFADERMPREGTYDQASTQAWADRVKSFDAVVLVVAQYNSGYTAPLKNAIDTLYSEWGGKPVGMVGYGYSGAAVALEQLTRVAKHINMAVVDATSPQLFFHKTLTPDGQILDGAPTDDLAGLYAALLAAPASAS